MGCGGSRAARPAPTNADEVARARVEETAAVVENGMRVAYRVNDYLDDEILITAHAPGVL